MKFLIDWILSLFKTTKPGEVVHEPEPVVEEAKIKPKTKKAAPRKKAATTKHTKAELNKLTKAKLVEHAKKHGMKVDSKLKKADLVDNIFKQQK